MKSTGTLITKEYFVADAQVKSFEDAVETRELTDATDPYQIEDADEIAGNHRIPHLRGSEESRSHYKGKGATPSLSRRKIDEMLIEDRLDQLETILPYYTRRRIYETSTITITKTLNDQRPMATLVAKNCLPQGFQFCSTKTRKSKLAQVSDDEKESFYFG